MNGDQTWQDARCFGPWILLVYKLKCNACRRFSSCCWISSLIQGADGSWSVETEVNLRRRSDNGKINSSPISATSPIIRLQLGCSYSIPVHTDDVDGDVVKCRWGSGSECGGVCNALTGATLTSVLTHIDK